jgi:hypothetical protein
MKNLKLSLIAAAVLFPFALAVAATDSAQESFAPAKQPLVVGQAYIDTAISAAVVDVAGILPEQPESVFDRLKIKFTGKKPSQELHTVGVYVGKGMVLSDNGIFVAGGQYRVTLADGRIIEAVAHREGGGVLLLKLSKTDGLPEPVKVATDRPLAGEDVTAFGSVSAYGGPRFTVMARGYVSAQSIPFFSDSTAPTLAAVKTDRMEPQTNFGPVFLRGRLVGVTVLSQAGEAYIVPADYIAPRLAKAFAEI